MQRNYSRTKHLLILKQTLIKKYLLHLEVERMVFHEPVLVIQSNLLCGSRAFVFEQFVPLEVYTLGPDIVAFVLVLPILLIHIVLMRSEIPFKNNHYWNEATKLVFCWKKNELTSNASSTSPSKSLSPLSFMLLSKFSVASNVSLGKN